ncbi:MAG: hypothetical protein A3A44_00630 [Candidatus Sungbacteria bacterium RIFCSPLOWO2_01_FULL_60_25]|uniref:Nudix hydrolase domain-containing protein n=1 Tax=Candidatus Sungbacteria bacterium RIFCSPLOWO2_01_FULL_60_25 TaxID=1802281 RepID=A0A1G2LBT5_9BACT|nr:MAG: hypothetical protein A3A44_00630 [Candidatus Sungbacteria bacterium RIFCSPLOWO2_01_FULL_60_25]
MPPKPRFSEPFEKKDWTEEMQARAIEVFGWVRQSRSVPPNVYEAQVSAGLNVSLEVVVVRPSARYWEVFLAQRSTLEENPSEPYPGMWHSPGVGFRISDGRTIRGALDRLRRNEFDDLPFRRLDLKSVKTIDDPDRGFYLMLIHLAEVDGEPTKGKWFRVDQLPQPLVGSHEEIVLPTAFAYLGEWANDCRAQLEMEDATYVALANKFDSQCRLKS